MSANESIRFSNTDRNSGPEVSVEKSGPYKTNNVLDPNVYATKKTIAQGMLDVALLTANASQLKYCLQLGKKHQFFYFMVTLISTSIVLQVIVGGLFVFVGYINFNDENRQKRLNLLNNTASIFVFIITVVNIIIGGFGLNFDNSSLLTAANTS